MIPIPSSSRPRVAILGAGWLGFPLARTLVRAGYPVSASSTTAEKLPLLTAEGIEAFHLQLTPQTTPAEVAPLLQQAQVLVLNVPPGQRREATPDPDAYARQLAPVAEALRASPVGRVVFVSSTGVYPDEPRLMLETDAVASPAATQALLRAEWLFAQPVRPEQTTTILRLGGLMGPGRTPGRFLAGRTDLPQASAPVNMLHLADAVGVIKAVIEQGVGQEVMNVCAPAHPTRQQFYAAATSCIGLEPPHFRYEERSGGKLIDTTHLHEVLHYTFRHPDPLAAIGHCR